MTDSDQTREGSQEGHEPAKRSDEREVFRSGEGLPRWLTHYPRVLAEYVTTGEDGLAELEEDLRVEAAKQPEGKFSKTDALYTPFVPIPPLGWRHKCEYCRFYVDSAPGEPAECMLVGREDDPWGGKAIHEKGGCSLFTPAAGEPPFSWIAEQLNPTGADLVPGEYHRRSEPTAVEIPITNGEQTSTTQTRKQPATTEEGRASRNATTKRVGTSRIPTGAPVSVEPIAEGFAAPIELLDDPTNSERRYIADQVGKLYLHDSDGLHSEPVLDLTGQIVELKPKYDERGLLGVVLHPEFMDNRRFYVRYSAPNRGNTPEEYDHTEVLAEFRMANDGMSVDPDSERVLLEVPEPQFNHNGGDITFGPDGYLYTSLGDGGDELDLGPGHVEGGNGQDVTENLLGSILRIDVDERDGTKPYAIPDDNPLVGEEGLAEQYAWGFRNPWRMSFDSQGRLFTGDVGQYLFEEVNVVEKGGNYGWRLKEGTHDFDPDTPKDPPETAPERNNRGERLIDPIIEYPHISGDEVIGSAVVGGYYYEGDEIPTLRDAYVFGDWTTSRDKPSSRLFVARPPESGEGLWAMKELEVASSSNGRLNRFVRGFARDRRGELYVLSNTTHVPKGTTGAVHKLVPAE